jgi:Zn-dependent protease with chaperone function
MFGNPRDVYLVVVAIALVPGAISWFLGRRLIRRISDPALPELLAGHRRRVGAVFGVGMALLSSAAVLSGAPIAFLIIAGFLICYGGLLAAAYPLRRALYDETWSFLAYFLFYPRSIVGVFGFWITLSALPMLVSFAGQYDWLFALPIGIVLAIWNRRYADGLRWSLRSEPLPEGDLLAGCRALAEKCELPHVRFERIPLGGGVIANALALPSLRGSSVLFTETLLERFTREEILAVAAHELAHFDHYNPAYLRHLSRGNYLLIAAGVAAAPVARLVGGESGMVASALWLLIVVVSLGMRARGKQRQETMCDLKAAKLTGNPDAVISGLTKLYTIARLPRRLDNRTEQAATHPSLARRIRDIRKAAGSEPAALATSHTFTSVDGRSKATFDGSGLQWTDQDGITYTVSYSHLTELRIDIASGRSTRLVAVGPSARRWELSLPDGDVAKVQAVLDSIDGKLADPAPQPFSFALPGNVRRIVLLAVITLGLSLWQLGMALVAILAWAKPTVPMFVAAGLAALATAAFMIRDLSQNYISELWLPLAILSLFFFGLAWSARQTPRDGTRKYIAVLAAVAALALAAVLAQGFDIFDLHRSARDLPSATVLMVALAGALFCSADRRERIGGLAAALVAGVMTSVASTPFLDRFGNDPFLVSSRPLRWIALNASPIVTLDVPSNTSRIVLSPSGQSVAVYNTNNDPDVSGEVHVGRVGATLRSMQAEDVVFVSDDQLLVLTSDTRTTAVHMETLGVSPQVVWRHEIGNLTEPTLSLSRVAKRWSLIGWDGEHTVLRIAGALDGSDIEEKQWPLGEDREGYVTALTSSGSDALVHEARYQPGLLSRKLPPQWTAAQMMLYVSARSVSHVSTINEDGQRRSFDSRLDVACLPDVLPGGALACTAYDGSRTHIVTVAASSDRAVGVGFVDGHFVTDRSGVEGWLTGWIMGRPVAIHLPTAAVFHTPPAMRTLRLIPVAGDRLAVLTFATQAFKAAVYAPLTAAGRAEEPIAENRARAAQR